MGWREIIRIPTAASFNCGMIVSRPSEEPEVEERPVWSENYDRDYLA